MLKNTKTNESGRSMVEMLGVLAVIGVLSVAGIAGYTTAMRSYRTNEIVNAASMLYVMAMAQNAGNGASGDVTYASLNNGTNPSGVSDITYTNGSITIKFNTKEDCDAAKAKLGDKAGECPATATDGAYPLTVTLGDAKQTGKTDDECALESDCIGAGCYYMDGPISGCYGSKSSAKSSCESSTDLPGLTFSEQSDNFAICTQFIVILVLVILQQTNNIRTSYDLTKTS